MPRAIKEDFHPSAEIHRINDWHTDIAEMAIHIARRA